LDRSKGDIHALGNPHFLVDPLNAKAAAGHIAEAFAAIDPASAEQYRAAYAKFAGQLDTKIVEWQRKLERHKGHTIVSYHNSWVYFAERFGLKTGLFLEPKPGIPPTPAHLGRVVAQMQQEGVKVILADPYINRRVAERVAKETGAVIVDVTQFPGGVKGTEGGYIQMMDYLVGAIASAH
jgi:ABC-type Zn uptake system ZnuABC Zn-binding protein ZnuA